MNKRRIRLLLSKHIKRSYKPRIWYLYDYEKHNIYVGEKYE